MDKVMNPPNPLTVDVDYTVKEYLEKSNDLEDNIYNLLALTCIGCLMSHLTDVQGPAASDEYLHSLLHNPLLSYAYDHWGDHTRESSAQCHPFIISFLSTCVNYPELAPREDVKHYQMSSTTKVLRLSGLHLAAMYGLVDIILSQHLVSPAVSRTGGLTPFHLAAMYNRAESLRALVEAGYTGADARSSDGETVLHIAFQYGSREVIQELLSPESPSSIFWTQGCVLQINSKGKYGKTPLMTACQIGMNAATREETVRLMLSRTDVEVNMGDNMGGTALMHAVLSLSGSHQTNIVSAFLERPDLSINIQNKFGRTALMHDMRQVDAMGALEGLLRHPDIQVNLQDDRGQTALIHGACYGASEDKIGALVSHPDIDVNARDFEGWTALMHAASRRLTRQESLKRLLSHPDTAFNIESPDGKTALMHAVERVAVDSVKSLVAFPGVDVNTQDPEGTTPLMYAVGLQVGSPSCWSSLEDRTTLIQLFLDHPSLDINIQDRDGKTAPMHLITGEEDDPFNSILSRPDIDLNIQDRRGRTALMMAFASHRGVDMRGFDVRDFDVRLRDENGWSALDWAICPGTSLCAAMMSTYSLFAATAFDSEIICGAIRRVFKRPSSLALLDLVIFLLDGLKKLSRSSCLLLDPTDDVQIVVLIVDAAQQPCRQWISTVLESLGILPKTDVDVLCTCAQCQGWPDSNDTPLEDARDRNPLPVSPRSTLSGGGTKPHRGVPASCMKRSRGDQRRLTAVFLI